MRQNLVCLLKMLLLQILGIASVIGYCLIAITQHLCNLVCFAQIKAIPCIHMRLQLGKIKGQRWLHIHEFLINFHLLFRLGQNFAFDILHDITVQNVLAIIQKLTFGFQLKGDGGIRLLYMSSGLQLIIFLLHMIVDCFIPHDDQPQGRTLHTAHAHAFSS